MLVYWFFFSQLVCGLPFADDRGRVSRSTSTLLLEGTRHLPTSLIAKRQDNDVYAPMVYDDYLNGGQLLWKYNLGIGTPIQQILVQVDTGSSDTWVLSDELCMSEPDCFGGYGFKPEDSETYELVDSGTFHIKYDDETAITGGDYFVDVVTFEAGFTIGVEMAVATDAIGNFSYGILGLGFDTDEEVATEGGEPYPSFLDDLVNSGNIDSALFSFYSDPIAPGSGGWILFGGIDNSEYSGDLAWLNMVPNADTGVYREYAITLDQWGLTSDPPKLLTSQNTDYVFVVDSGTSLTILPTDVYDAIISSLPFVVSDDTVPCDLPPGSVDYYFGEAKISVPFKFLALDIGFGDGTCYFGLQRVKPGHALLLGDTFMQNAYVAYDLDNKKIGLAQRNYGS